MNIKILGSQCAVSNYYQETVEKIAQSLNLTYTIEKIEDDEQLRRYAVYIGCLIGYCPGCNYVPRDSSADKYTPALVINGELKLHSCFPSDEIFIKLLSEYL
ncbi:hypothetical protein P22_0881 [Propionispora sp. 2/2-37]|uniref:thioredoxin family protein n=1 Tax=Propionispora sp. 2/2-37 TaxID=1677858 RepID=UPI0006BB5D0D|nr:thioredoxin family protein [Propionispora sp. 2/2-37]CUH94815.1 hypothetical protein P22_0881 [Propionispora sp. 2/2-37]